MYSNICMVKPPNSPTKVCLCLEVYFPHRVEYEALLQIKAAMKAEKYTTV